MKIILIGFMGSGKSSVGKLLSKKLNLPLIETDDQVLNQSGRKDMNEIFEKVGEVWFRELETEVIRKLISLDNAVIATGGGVVMDKVNISFLKAKGKNMIIFLKTEFNTIKARLKNHHDRPLFANIKNAKKLFEIRKPLYENCADMVVTTDQKSIESIVEEILKRKGVL